MDQATHNKIVSFIEAFIRREVFSPQNLWCMRQFFETYRDNPKLSTLVRVLPWSSHLGLLKGGKA